MNTPLLDGIMKVAQSNVLTHYRHSNESLITPSLSELHTQDPAKAQEVLEKLIIRGRRTKDYLKWRAKTERMLRSRADKAGIQRETDYPIYATYGGGGLFRGEETTKIPIAKVLENTTFTIGDSFPAMETRGTPGPDRRSRHGRKVYTYDQIQELLREAGGLKKLKQQSIDYDKGKGYIEAQIWKSQADLERMFQ